MTMTIQCHKYKQERKCGGHIQAKDVNGRILLKNAYIPILYVYMKGYMGPYKLLSEMCLFACASGRQSSWYGVLHII